MARTRPSVLGAAVALAAVVIVATVGGAPAVDAAVAPWVAPPAAALRAAAGVGSAATDAAEVSLPTPTSRGFFKKTWKKIKKGVRDAGRAIAKPVKEAGKAVSTVFKKASKAISNAARDAGRAVEKAVRDAGRAIEKAGKDAAKFVSRSLKELKTILAPSKKRGEAAQQQAEAAAAAAAAADQAAAEREASQALVDLTAGADGVMKVMAETTTLLDSEAGALTGLLGGLSKPVSSLMKSRVTYSRDYAVDTLAHGEATAIEARNFIKTIKTTVQDLVAGATKLPASKTLQEVATKAELVLASLVAREVDIAIAIESVSRVVQDANALLA